MITLEKVFARFPKLTDNQRTELCRRRIILFLNQMPSELDHQFDIYYALSYLGTKNLFKSYREEVSNVSTVGDTK